MATATYMIFNKLEHKMSTIIYNVHITSATIIGRLARRHRNGTNTCQNKKVILLSNYIYTFRFSLLLNPVKLIIYSMMTCSNFLIVKMLKMYEVKIYTDNKK